jgi:hypothetical protein
MSTLFSTPCSLPSALSFLAVSGRSQPPNTLHFSLILTAALEWSMACDSHAGGLPAAGGFATGGPARLGRDTIGGGPVDVLVERPEGAEERSPGPEPRNDRPAPSYQKSLQVLWNGHLREGTTVSSLK